jgi:acetylcholinesterase
VALHMMAYGGRNDHLFVGGVAESVFFPAQPYLHELEWQFERVAKQSGCNGTQDVMSCLRSRDTESLQLINTAQPFPNRTAAPDPLFYWTPCIDGVWLEDLPYNLLEEGKYIDVPIIFGDDTNEGSVFVSNATSEQDFTDFMQDNYPMLDDDDIAAILVEYPAGAPLPGLGAWYSALSAAYGEATFTCPAINLLTLFTSPSGSASNSSTPANNLTAWSYRYDVQDDENVAAGEGVPHIFEIAAIFGPGNIQGGGPESYYTYNAPIVPVVMDYWISFVKSLDPNTYRNATAPRWEPWSNATGAAGGAGSRIVMRTGNLTMETVPAEQIARCQFWLQLAQTMEQKRR